MQYCLGLGYERDRILELIDENYEHDEELILKEIAKLKKSLMKYAPEKREQIIIRKLKQKGYSYDEIKDVI